MQTIDLAAARASVSYDPKTGQFIWLVNKRGHRRAGDVAGSIARCGYYRVKINQRTYLAHRLAWAMYYGAEPKGEIDHIDGDPMNNRIENLREATRAQNCQNVKAKGVRYESERGAWLARICVNYRQINLGRYKTKAEAQGAYHRACKEHRGRFARAPH